MKTRMTIFASLLLAGFAFTSCDDDNDNYTPDEKIVNVLYEKYPNAQRIDWELQHDHYVADFYDNNIEKEAWFNTKGEWVMTESDILFKNLPEAVQTAFNESDYKNWKIEDVNGMYLEYKNNRAIAINYNRINNKNDEKCTLSEELGHYYMNATYPASCKNKALMDKQEYRAKKWSYTILIPYEDLKSAIKKRY